MVRSRQGLAAGVADLKGERIDFILVRNTGGALLPHDENISMQVIAKNSNLISFIIVSSII